MNSLFSYKLFRCIFRSDWKVYSAENDQIKYLFKTSLLKSHFSLCKLLLDFATTAINYVFYVWVVLKGLFHYPGNCMFLICIRLWKTTTLDRIHPLSIRKREPYKNLKNFNKESKPWYTPSNRYLATTFQ